MPIVSLYGLSETSAALTMQEFPTASLENQGQPLPGTQLKIHDVNEKGVGEICVKGRNVFMGYLNNEEATMDAFDEQGFYHTGD